MVSYARVARRIRVPLGFVFAAGYLWLAKPQGWSILTGAGVAAVGVAVRALASGHVRKNMELTVTGPYAHTRNPLYLGSMIIGAGFAVAARSIWVVVVMGLLLLLIYLPVVRSEEAYLRSQFPEFEAYARRVPRFAIRFRVHDPGWSFSGKLYLQHKEYNAALGSLALIAALALKLMGRAFWLGH